MAEGLSMLPAVVTLVVAAVGSQTGKALAATLATAAVEQVCASMAAKRAREQLYLQAGTAIVGAIVMKANSPPREQYYGRVR